MVLFICSISEKTFAKSFVFINLPYICPIFCNHLNTYMVHQHFLIFLLRKKSNFCINRYRLSVYTKVDFHNLLPYGNYWINLQNLKKIEIYDKENVKLQYVLHSNNGRINFVKCISFFLCFPISKNNSESIDLQRIAPTYLQCL